MVSFIIIAFNAEKTIRQCIISIVSQDIEKKIILVDNGSTDQTVEYANNYPVQIFHEPKKNRGIARNVGLRQSNNKYVAFVDSDVELPKDWTNKAIKLLEMDNLVAGVGGPGKTPSNSWIARSIDLLQFGNSINKEEKEVSSIATMNVVYRATAIDNLFFRPLWAGEDPDFNFRLTKRGYKLIWSSDLWVTHHHIENFTTLIKKTFLSASWYFPLYIHNVKEVNLSILFRFIYFPLLVFSFIHSLLFNDYLILFAIISLPTIVYTVFSIQQGLFKKINILQFIIVHSSKQYAQLLGIYLGWIFIKNK